VTAPLEGSCDPRFASVRTRFAELLADGAETGAGVCVYLGAEPVVDLWGGWADTARTRPWSRDTVVPTYSVTKAPAAVALLTVVDRGLVGLDDPVESVWPEYGAAGKSATTVRHLLAHRAGLPAFPEPRDDPAAWSDWADLTAMLARARPEWEPGTAHAEHALTYGHLLGEVVRRVDGRTLGQVWRDDVAAPWALDFQIGLRDDEAARVAELEYATPDWPAEAGGAPGSMRERAVGNPAGARDLAVLSSDVWRRCEIPAVNGHGTARAVARFYAGVTGQLDRPLLSDRLRGELLTPVATGHDALLDREVTWGLGVQFDESYVGMGGLGGSDGLADLRRGYSYGYVTRRLDDHDRSVALTDAIEAVLDRT
jgi:CubicO group peptidase (beta-lactamase class C family)